MFHLKNTSVFYYICIGNLHKKFPSKFCFNAYCLNVTPILQEAQIELL